MSQTLESIAKETLQFSLKVKHEAKPTTILSTAKLLSKDLRVKVKDVGIMFETHKKAWLIDVKELSADKMISTILQQTTTKAWVTFEIIHDKDVEIDKTWVQIKKAQRDISIMLYPSYFVIGVLAVIEFMLLKKTLIDKDIIILSRDDWRVIIWISVAVIAWFVFVFFYTNKLMLHEAYFHSVGFDFVSSQNYDFYMTPKKFTKTVTLRYILNCYTYRGYYSHPDLPEKLPFKAERSTLAKIETIQNELKILKDTTRNLMQTEADLSFQYTAAKNEEKELMLQLKNLSQDEESPNFQEVFEDLEEVKAALAVKAGELLEKKKLITMNRGKGEIAVETKQVDLYNELKTVYQFDEKKISEERFQELIYASQLNSKLRIELAETRNLLMIAKESEARLYSTLAQLQQFYKQSVAEEAARRTTTQYTYTIEGESVEGMAPVTAPSSVSTRRRGIGMNSDILTSMLAKVIVFGLFVGGIVWLVIYLVKNLGMINPWLAALAIGFTAIILLIGNKLINKLFNWSADRDMSIKT
jgi:hypothetical protein